MWTHPWASLLRGKEAGGREEGGGVEGVVEKRGRGIEVEEGKEGDG